MKARTTAAGLASIAALFVSGGAQAGCSAFGVLPPYSACRTLLANDDPYPMYDGYVNGTPYRPAFARSDDLTAPFEATVASGGLEPWFRPYCDEASSCRYRRRWRPRHASHGRVGRYARFAGRDPFGG